MDDGRHQSRRANRSKVILGWLILLLLWPSGSIWADSEAGFDRAYRLYQEGQWQEAIDLATSLDTAPALALAARIRLLASGYVDDEAQQRAAIAAAMADAQRALSIDPDFPEATLQYAAAIGFRARLDRSASDGREVKRLIDDLMQRDPENPWTHAALGTWHGEVVVEGGAFLAALFFGATRKKALASLERAVALEPDNLAILLAYAKLLVRFGKKNYHEPAQAILNRALSLPAKSAMDRLMQDHARLLLDAFDANDRDALDQALAAVTPFRRR